VLHSFTGGSDGEDPGDGNLVFDQAGNLYGATATGGYGEGLVYEFSPSNGGWKETVLYDFNGDDGFNPNSGLLLDNAGNLYGTTEAGGAEYFGVVFELSRNGSGWTEQVLSSVDFPDTDTCGGVVMDGHADQVKRTNGIRRQKSGGIGSKDFTAIKVLTGFLKTSVRETVPEVRIPLSRHCFLLNCTPMVCDLPR